MSVPCEVAVKCVLPVVRAMVAKELRNDIGLRQVDVAKLLKVSQPAISLYQRDMRGKAIDLEKDQEIQRMVSQMAKALSNDRLPPEDLVFMYCEICKTIRSKGLMCKLHKAFDSTVDIENCEVCKSKLSSTCFH